MLGCSLTPRPRLAALALCVGCLIALAYAEVARNGFVAIDDPRYVYDNAVVARGITWDGVGWAFTAFHASNWHPITWLSHMLDVELFGLRPGWHHCVNVALHVANAVLLLVLLHVTTGAVWRSALVAALFGVHPLHVESVAWIAERKDVLSTFFWFATALAYVGYVRRGGRARYAAVIALYATGLAAKPMLVTLPLTLLLLDAWPLRRLEGKRVGDAWPLVREKLPLFFLSAASSIVTMVAQDRGGAISTLELLSPVERVANSFVAYAAYVRDAIWPSGLAPYYPHPSWSPGGLAPWKAIAAGAALAAITVVVIALRRSRPSLAVGWAWFVVTLLPVIGLVQVGAQARADRYTYVPLVGLFVMVAWALPEASSIAHRSVMGIAASSVVLAASVATHAQTRYWRDTQTLFTRAIAVTDDNWFAWRIIGLEHFQAGNYREATVALREAARAFPDNFDIWMSLGAAASASGDNVEAARAFSEAIDMAPTDATAWFSLGMAWLEGGSYREAARAFERTVAIDPRHAGAWAGAALANALRGRPDLAMAARGEVERLDPALATELAARLSSIGAR